MHGYSQVDKDSQVRACTWGYTVNSSAGSPGVRPAQGVCGADTEARRHRQRPAVIRRRPTASYAAVVAPPAAACTAVHHLGLHDQAVPARQAAT